jgi:RNA polymerase sigma factor (sigma-70 family)
MGEREALAERKDLAGASDADLARSALSGDRAAFGELVERHARQVVALTYAMVGDREKARDLAQDAFLAAFQALGSLREPGRFGAWLAGIARRQCIYAIRRERRAARALEARREAPLVVLSGPEGTAARSDEEARVLAALNRLGRRYREVLVLRHLEGRSYGDIADVLGLSAAAVEKRLTRARGMLRKAMEVGKP